MSAALHFGQRTLGAAAIGVVSTPYLDAGSGDVSTPYLEEGVVMEKSMASVREVRREEGA